MDAEPDDRIAGGGPPVEEEQLRWLLGAVAVFAAAWFLYIAASAGLTVRRVRISIRKTVVADCRRALDGLRQELIGPITSTVVGPQKPPLLALGAGGGRLDLLAHELVEHPELALVRILDRRGRVLAEKADEGRIPIVGEPIEVSLDGALLVGLASENEVSRRGREIRGEVIEVALTFGTVGALAVLAALAWVQRRIERSRRSVAARIQQARLAEVGALAAGLAHEIRNPLNSLRLNVQLVEEDLRELGGAGAADRLRLLSRTRGEIGRLERLVEDFLQYARPRRPERQKLDLLELATAALAAVQPELEADGVRVEVDAPSPPPSAELDPGQVVQVLINLLRNAREAVAVRSPADRRVRIEIGSDGESVRLAVADSGLGVSEEELPRLGTLFYSTKKGGTGLGLPIARRVCEEHGGELLFESRPDRGLRVTMRLPKRG